jgi:hypothetical protein
MASSKVQGKESQPPLSTERRARFIQAIEDSSGEAVGLHVGEGVGWRPNQKRMPRRPNLAKSLTQNS